MTSGTGKVEPSTSNSNSIFIVRVINSQTIADKLDYSNSVYIVGYSFHDHSPFFVAFSWPIAHSLPPSLPLRPPPVSPGGDIGVVVAKGHVNETSYVVGKALKNVYIFISRTGVHTLLKSVEVEEHKNKSGLQCWHLRSDQETADRV